MNPTRLLLGSVVLAVASVVCLALGAPVDIVYSLGLLGLGAVTVEQYIDFAGPDFRVGIPVVTAKKLLGGTICFVDANGFATDVIAAGVNTLGGIVVETVDNTAGASGDVEVEVHDTGRVLLTGSSFTQADVGSKAYATDNYTVTATSTNNTYIGTFRKFKSATKMWVELDKQTA